ncbi:MAG TPA: hypothetical protein VJB67_02125 [Patescibacteria group bacterium]|nr:hypothetical protein [Patescibacteria group bacterium]
MVAPPPREYQTFLCRPKYQVIFRQFPTKGIKLTLEQVAKTANIAVTDAKERLAILVRERFLASNGRYFFLAGHGSL